MSAASLTSLRPIYMPAVTGLTLGLLAWGLLFLPECTAAVGVWRASDTYGHCFLILPMALYLAWDRRGALAGLLPRPMPALAPFALPIAAIWFLAERLGVMEGRQLAALAALELLFLTVLGWRLFRALRAPLLFLVFLVPFGAFVTPALQQFTAGFIVGGLNVLGIANYSTDLTIEISAGVFYVAEACAGLRFLIAAIAFGVFYALLNYRSPGRRVLFVLASIIVPIVANWVRALGIVVLGAVMGSAEAAAADHIIYGWVFFSMVMLLLVAGGMPFRETPTGPMQPSGPPDTLFAETRPMRACLAVIVLLASGPMASMLLTWQLTPARLTGTPGFATPPGCTADPGSGPGPPVQHAIATFLCADQRLVVTMQAFPRRSTADSLLRERRSITGELSAEEVVLVVLPTSRTDNGDWSLIHTAGPTRATAVASWTDGAPARGDMAGRIRQAQDSLFGTAYAPILMTAAIELSRRLAPADQPRIDAILSGFVDAQTELTAQVAKIARSVQE